MNEEAVSPMTVGELIEKLSNLPSDAAVQMTMKIKVTTSIGKDKEGNEKFHNHDAYCYGHVYGVSSAIGHSKDVIIAGS